MIHRSARLAAKAITTEAESSNIAPADSLADELASIKASMSTLHDIFNAQMDNVKAYCDTAIQIAKNSILETVQAELQAAASNTNALITQRTDPIQQRLNSVEAAVEHSERMRRSTSMIVKGFTPASTFTHRQTTASVHQLLAQHATNQQFSITSVTVFGNPADGPKPIRVVFSSTEDKHAAHTASKGLRSERIYLDTSPQYSCRSASSCITPTHSSGKGSCAHSGEEVYFSAQKKMASSRSRSRER